MNKLAAIKNASEIDESWQPIFLCALFPSFRQNYLVKNSKIQKFKNLA